MGLGHDIEKAPGCDFPGVVRDAPKEGLVLEFGVGGGTSLRLVAKQITDDRTVYGFDSFEGLPESWRNYGVGTFKCDVPDMPSNVKLVIGLFQDTLVDFLKEHPENIAYVHFDADLYSSTKYVFDTCKDRFVEGSVLQFDEICGWAPAENTDEGRAFLEFIEENDFHYSVIGKTGDEQVAFRLHRGKKHE